MKIKYKIFTGLYIFLPFLVITIFANAVVLKYNNNIFSDINEAPTTTTALVFGGGMNKDGSMSAMQYDRVITAVKLYKLGKVKELVMTGDDGANKDDEVTAMWQFAIANDVPLPSVKVDPHGYRTYESCYRANKVYGITTAIAISQSFHLPRIRYFCEKMGIKTIGLSTNLRDYHTIWVPYIREYLARVKGWWQMEVTHPLPRTLSVE